MKENVDRVGRREDHERRLVQVLDRLAHPLVRRELPDLECGYLHDRRPEIDKLPAERIDLVAGPRDEDPPPMQRPFRHAVEALGHLDARTQHEQRIAAGSVRGRLARELAERRRDAMLARESGVQDQRGGRLRGAPVLEQRGDARVPPARREAQHDCFSLFDQAEANRRGQALDRERDAAHHRRRELDDQAWHGFEIDAGSFQTFGDLAPIGECIWVAGTKHCDLAPVARETNYLIDGLERSDVGVRAREMQEAGAAAIVIADDIGLFPPFDRLHGGQAWMAWSNAYEADPAHATIPIPTRDTARD